MNTRPFLGGCFLDLQDGPPVAGGKKQLGPPIAGRDNTAGPEDTAGPFAGRENTVGPVLGGTERAQPGHGFIYPKHVHVVHAPILQIFLRRVYSVIFTTCTNEPQRFLECSRATP